MFPHIKFKYVKEVSVGKLKIIRLIKAPTVDLVLRVKIKLASLFKVRIITYIDSYNQFPAHLAN